MKIHHVNRVYFDQQIFYSRIFTQSIFTRMVDILCKRSCRQLFMLQNSPSLYSPVTFIILILIRRFLEIYFLRESLYCTRAKKTVITTIYDVCNSYWIFRPINIVFWRHKWQWCLLFLHCIRWLRRLTNKQNIYLEHLIDSLQNQIVIIYI